LQLAELQSEAELEIKRITDSDARLSHYQDTLQTLLDKAPSPNDRFKTVAIMIESHLSEISNEIKLIESEVVDNGKTNT